MTSQTPIPWPLLSRISWPTHQWPVRAAEASRSDVSGLDNAVSEAGSRLAYLHGIVVVREGVIIGERYFPGSERMHIHRLHSVTSVVGAALVGAAMNRGYLRRLDRPLAALLPQLEAPLAQLTLRQLLSMTSGIGWGDPLRQRAADVAWRPREDWLAAARDRPPDAALGAYFSFASPATQLLAPLLKWTTGRDVQRFADEELFQPMGIRSWVWEQDPSGDPLMQVGLSLTARDLAKIGLLYLSRGCWEGARILPGPFVVASVQPRAFGTWPRNQPYGYGWWVSRFRNTTVVSASGYGEQYLVMLPELDVVIVLTGDDERPEEPYESHWGWFETRLIPALMGVASL